jgi:hypothetical protein
LRSSARALLRPLDLVEDLLPPGLDRVEALLEGIHAAAHHLEVRFARTAGGWPVPEQSGRAELAELFQPTAHRVQQPELLPLGGEARQLAVDGSQILHEPVQPLARLVEPRADRLFVLGSYVLHVFV